MTILEKAMDRLKKISGTPGNVDPYSPRRSGGPSPLTNQGQTKKADAQSAELTTIEKAVLKMENSEADLETNTAAKPGRFRRYLPSFSIGAAAMGTAKVLGAVTGTQALVSAGAAAVMGVKGYRDEFNRLAKEAAENGKEGPARILDWQKAKETFKEEKGLKSLTKAFNDSVNFKNFNADCAKVGAKKAAVAGVGAVSVWGVSELVDMAPEGFFDGITNFVRDLWNGLGLPFWSSDAEPVKSVSVETPEIKVASEIVTEPLAAEPAIEPEIDPKEPIEEPAIIEEPVIALEDMAPADRFEMVFNDLLSTLDTETLSEAAQNDLINAQAGDLESIQNIAFYIANDLEGFEGFNAENDMTKYDVAIQIAEIGADNDNLNATKFLAQLDLMGFDIAPDHAETYEAIMGEPVQLAHEEALSNAHCSVTGDVKAFEMDCEGTSSQLLRSGDTLSVNFNGDLREFPYKGSTITVGNLFFNHVAEDMTQEIIAAAKDNAVPEQYATLTR
jgi:hypothetical protein